MAEKPAHETRLVVMVGIFWPATTHGTPVFLPLSQKPHAQFPGPLLVVTFGHLLGESALA